MTRSTISGFGWAFGLVTVSSADAVEIEAPAFGGWPFWLGGSVLFHAKTARVAQVSATATDLK